MEDSQSEIIELGRKTLEKFLLLLKEDEKLRLRTKQKIVTQRKDNFEKIKGEIKNTVWSDDSQVQETASELANKVYNRSYDVFKDKGGVWQAKKHKLSRNCYV